MIHRVASYHGSIEEILEEVNRELKKREKPPTPYRGEGMPT